MSIIRALAVRHAEALLTGRLSNEGDIGRPELGEALGLGSSLRGVTRSVNSAEAVITTVTPAYRNTSMNALPIVRSVHASTPSIPMCLGIRPGRRG
ncbi:hypothetical protein [Streptomyces gobitricini]|uniref:hypothetical protein n=1 Tax=Streptomyces gobitricini TaxID=68211 RepID=UPI0031D7F696